MRIYLKVERLKKSWRSMQPAALALYMNQLKQEYLDELAECEALVEIAREMDNQ